MSKHLIFRATLFRARRLPLNDVSGRFNQQDNGRRCDLRIEDRVGDEDEEAAPRV